METRIMSAARGLALFLMLWAIPAISSAQPLRIVAEAYPGWANEDGSGYYFDLLRKVYDGTDVTLEFKVVPFTRALRMIERGTAEITPVTYRGDLPDGHLSLQVTTATDLVAALYLPDTIPTWRGASSLSGLRVGALQGYALGQFLPADSRYTEESSVDGLLRMLARNRIDVLLDFEERLQGAASDYAPFIKQTAVIKIPGFAAFSMTPQGKKAKNLFEERMPLLLGSKALAEVFERYDISAEEEPRLVAPTTAAAP